jgi:hypothetical protein
METVPQAEDCAVSQARQCHTIVKSLIDLKKES